jgi:chaperone required for assembly of F1-ATPase
MKRFYKAAVAERAEEDWRETLDGRAVKTAGGQPQLVPTERLAQALAAEWQAQGDEIVPETLVLRDLADYALDVVAPGREPAIRALLAFAETDTLCYRGDEGEALHQRQVEVWEPLLIAAERRWDVHFTRVCGIVHQPQAPATIARLEAALAALGDFQLAALNTLAGLSASLAIGFAALEPQADPHALWNAANLEEDWQAELWGKDAEALALRERRFAAFVAAMRFVQLARQEP